MHKYDHTNLFIQPHNDDMWSENEESSDTKTKSDLPLILAPEGDENEGKGLKILTPNKLLTRRQILLA